MVKPYTGTAEAERAVDRTTDKAANGDSAPTELLQRTPGLILGPFFPLDAAPEWGAYTWIATTSNRPSTHRPLTLSGRVINRSGAPVAGALLEMWQADESGHYRHPSAPEPVPLEPGFRGYAAVRSDAMGRYQFRTRKPGAYIDGMQQRAPHLHFQVTGQIDRLVTQMFFPGEALNATDHWYNIVRRNHQLIARAVSDTPAGLALTWDIVLTTG